MPERGAQIAVLSPSSRRILALTQVVIEKSLDCVLVDPIDLQPTLAHPKCKLCDACDVHINSARCVPALCQMMLKRSSVGRQLAIEKPVRRMAVKSSCRVHCGLLK